MCCSSSHQADSRRELPLDASLAPHPAPSYPIPTHSIPSHPNTFHPIPSHSIPSHVISSHPTPSQLILWLSISWPHWTTTHRAGDPQGCPAPAPDAAPAPREGPTAAFVCWGALQGKPGLDPMQRKLLLSVHQNLLFSNAKKSFFMVFFFVQGMNGSMGELGRTLVPNSCWSDVDKRLLKILQRLLKVLLIKGKKLGKQTRLGYF